MARSLTYGGRATLTLCPRRTCGAAPSRRVASCGDELNELYCSGREAQRRVILAKTLHWF